MSADGVAFAVDNPPLETEPLDGEEHTFTIAGSKTMRRFHVDGGGAHVVTGYFDGDEDVGWMTLADADYAIEAWDYETMQPVEGVGAKLVPEYYVIIDFNQAVVYPFHYRPHPKYDEGAYPPPPLPIKRH
ncbi:hypothetical protein VTI74DRAFT_9307 [Chaetomium olivicolor]